MSGDRKPFGERLDDALVVLCGIVYFALVTGAMAMAALSLGAVFVSVARDLLQ